MVFTGNQCFARKFYGRRSAVSYKRCDRDGDRRRAVLVRKTQTLMEESYQIGDRVEIYLDEKFGDKEGWYAGTVFKIDPYSGHRSFYWVTFDTEAQMKSGTPQISVFNLKNIRKIK